MSTSSYFSRKTVIVTDSSSGIGREAAVLFAEFGANVTITGRSAEAIKNTKDLCIAVGAKHDSILEIITDIGEAREKIIDETVKSFGGIDILVLNVGQSDSVDCNGLSVEMFEMKTLKSMLVLTNLAVPHLVKSNGAVLNESSFISTRSAIDNLIVQTATMLMNTGIRVNSINHGLLKTGMASKLDLPKEYEGALIYLGQNVWILPFGRVAAPSDIAKLIVFLSDRMQSQLIIGQRVIVE